MAAAETVDSLIHNAFVLARRAMKAEKAFDASRWADAAAAMTIAAQTIAEVQAFGTPSEDDEDDDA